MTAFCHPAVLKKCTVFSITFLGQFEYVHLDGETFCALEN